MIVLFYSSTVCGGGRADHITGGSVSVLPKEGLPQRGLHRYHLLLELPVWPHYGYKGKSCIKKPIRQLCISQRIITGAKKFVKPKTQPYFHIIYSC